MECIDGKHVLIAMKCTHPSLNLLHPFGGGRSKQIVYFTYKMPFIKLVLHLINRSTIRKTYHGGIYSVAVFTYPFKINLHRKVNPVFMLLSVYSKICFDFSGQQVRGLSYLIDIVCVFDPQSNATSGSNPNHKIFAFS